MFSFGIKICQKPNYRFKTLKMHEHSIVLTHCPFVGSRDNILHKNADTIMLVGGVTLHACLECKLLRPSSSTSKLSHY